MKLSHFVALAVLSPMASVIATTYKYSNNKCISFCISTPTYHCQPDDWQMINSQKVKEEGDKRTWLIDNNRIKTSKAVFYGFIDEQRALSMASNLGSTVLADVNGKIIGPVIQDTNKYAFAIGTESIKTWYWLDGDADCSTNDGGYSISSIKDIKDVTIVIRPVDYSCQNSPYTGCT